MQKMRKKTGLFLADEVFYFYIGVKTEEKLLFLQIYKKSFLKIVFDGLRYLNLLVASTKKMCLSDFRVIIISRTLVLNTRDEI